ncbi:MAG: hypothetical protein LBN24_04115 [Mediterranea sp.]|jgi:hypothetical protein|nr:hypothetical protein [Mediterranea sp.]
MKYDLTDTTFMIPVRIDTIERLENLAQSVQFLYHQFDCHIIVMEASRYNNGFIRSLLGNKISYLYIEDFDSVFYRTKFLNTMTGMVTTPYLSIWDADVVVDPIQIVDTIEKLRSGKYRFGIPYDGTAYEVTAILREQFISDPRIELLHQLRTKMPVMYGIRLSRGGAVFVQTETYRKTGMENIAFYGWGAEDAERIGRWHALGYDIYAAEGVLYHLTHPRGNNSQFSRSSQSESSDAALFATAMKSVEEFYCSNI